MQVMIAKKYRTHSKRLNYEKVTGNFYQKNSTYKLNELL